MDTLTIRCDTGRVVILGDLHLDSYDRLAVDPFALLNLEYATDATPHNSAGAKVRSEPVSFKGFTLPDWQLSALTSH